MIETIQIGDPMIEVRIRRHRRARRMLLRVGRSTSIPVLTVPTSLSIQRARAFAIGQEAWLRRQLAAQRAATPVRPGIRLPYRGEVVRLIHDPADRTAIHNGTFIVSGPAAEAPVRAEAHLRDAARHWCGLAAETHSQRVARTYRRITIRDPRSRWGSCSSAGNLMLSWRLVMAPDFVLDYVVAHEVAHLVEMNHTTAFWAVVSDLVADPARSRRWLREHGPSLFSLDFSPNT